MDFWLTEDHVDLQAAMRTFVTDRFPTGTLLDVEATSSAVDAALWRELGDMGVFSMVEDGFGVRSAVLAFEELGRGLVPGPLVTSHLAAGIVEGAAEGLTIVGHFDPTPTGTFVEHAPSLASALWFEDDDVRIVDASDLTLTEIKRPLDAASPVWLAAEDPNHTVIGDAELSDALSRRGTVLTAALLLGVSLAAVDLARDYALGREQFGRAIGSFQAVKHLLAEMLVKAEVARSAVYSAACAGDGASDDEPNRAASVAKVMAGEAALFCGKTGIQVHGGMGFTWELDAQRYWKRAVVLDASFGSRREHAGRAAADLIERS